MKPSSFLTALTAALTDVADRLPAGACERMAQHWELVLAWNARVNLTAVTDDIEAAWRHYRDSLEGLRVLPGGEIVDLGSGAGFPGIPLALADTRRQVTLVEPRRKRVSFLEVVATRLELANVRVVYGSSNDVPDRLYAAAVTRATFSAADEMDECLAWVVPGGRVVAYRSEPSGLPGTEVHPYRIRDARRVLELWSRPR